MAKYRVEFHGSTEVDADSQLEAECNAAFECRPDNCRAELVDGEEESGDALEPSEVPPK